MDEVPLWLLFILTTLLILLAIEGGYRIGRVARRRSPDEKEAPVGAIVGTVLALLAFMLAFTFGIVSDRYDLRKHLVREHAAAISTSYARADVLPEPERSEAKALYVEYIALVIEAADMDSVENLPAVIGRSQAIQQQLWDMAFEHVRLGDDSAVSALFLESINVMGDLSAERISVAIETRIPNGIWFVLYALVTLGMMAVGYQTAIAESRRTLAMLVLAFSFAVVFIVIAALDNPERGYLPVSQKPLINVQSQMVAPAP